MNILLLHGALGTREQLKELQEQIPYSTRGLDLSGHGQRSAVAAKTDLSDLLQDIENALTEAGWEQAHLFGYSMGGYAALLFANRQPHRVRSVVTLGTKLKWDREGLDREIRMLDPRKMKEKVPHFATELARLHGPEYWESVVNNTASIITSLHERPLLTPDVLSQLKCPVLLCVGDQDLTAVPEHTLDAARQMPDAGVLVLPGTKHPVQAVDPRTFLPHLLKFWNDAEGLESRSLNMPGEAAQK